MDYVHLLNAFTSTRPMNTVSKLRIPTTAGNYVCNCLWKNPKRKCCTRTTWKSFNCVSNWNLMEQTSRSKIFLTSSVGEHLAKQVRIHEYWPLSQYLTAALNPPRFETLDNAAVEYIQQTMMEYLRREFVDNTTGSEESCMHHVQALYFLLTNMLF